jgi:fermentation-respiration switch protein FrsA (DUF1100 family)
MTAQRTAILLLALTVVFGLLWLAFFVFQKHLVYFPTSRILATPDQAGLGYEPITFVSPSDSADGVQLDAWFIPAPAPRGVVLYCHGNGGNISHRLEIIELLNRVGLSVFIFDYRGYGRSQGSPSEQGTYDDAEAAWQYLSTTRGIDPAHIVLWGESLGGAIASQLTAQLASTSIPPAVLVLQSTFTHINDVGAKHYPLLPVRWLSHFQYETVGHLARLRTPLLVIHSRDDALIEFSHGQRIFEAAFEPKQFLEITGDHNSGLVASAATLEPALDNILTSYGLTTSGFASPDLPTN